MSGLKKQKKGELIVLSGPSGVGKSTVIAELLSNRPDIYFSRVLYHPGAPGGRGGWRKLQLRHPGGV